MDEINLVTTYKSIQYFEMPIQGAQAYIPDNPHGPDRKGGCTNDTRAWADKLKQFTAMLDAPPEHTPGLERLMAVKPPCATGAA